MEENGNVVYELYVWPPTLKKSYSWWMHDTMVQY
jgi:hypothetical protein